MEPLPPCPACGHPLKIVPYNPQYLLNRDQWEATKAGDYFCPTCPGTRGNTRYRYYWRHELVAPPAP